MTSARLVKKRTGFPSPLFFHLNAALFETQSNLSTTSISDFSNAIEQLSTMLSGIKKWQNHPFEREDIAPPPVWRKGSSSLLDYEVTNSASNIAPPILIIPSLVNKSYILDITKEDSFIRRLQAQGLRPFLLDWGTPDASEFGFSISDFVTERALPAMSHIHNVTGRDTGLVGYCMGGSIAAAIAQIHPNVNALCTVGAPWDFENPTNNRLALKRIAQAEPREKICDAIDWLTNAFGAVPFEFLQYLFAAIKPNQAFEKFQRFATQNVDSRAEKNFVIIEDWLSDGVALAGPSAKTLLLDWHVDNQIMQGNWRVGNTAIDAKKISVPGAFVCGQKDSIAPLDTTLALPNCTPNAQILLPNAGHVGMIIGAKSQTEVVNPLAEFLKRHAQ